MLKYLLRHKHAAWFADPVDPVGMGIPHYAEIIKTPMDFGTIKGKYKGGRYASAEAFAADVRLVFRNATTFNKGADEPVHVAAVQLGAKFEERFESAMEDASGQAVRRRRGGGGGARAPPPLTMLCIPLPPPGLIRRPHRPLERVHAAR